MKTRKPWFTVAMAAASLWRWRQMKLSGIIF